MRPTSVPTHSRHPSQPRHPISGTQRVRLPPLPPLLYPPLTHTPHSIQTLQQTCANDFTAQQQKVLAIQNQGIQIRASNQQLAQQLNSPAQDGLATVAMAQLLEVSQVKSLQGTTGQMDQATFKMLVQEVMDGTMQNMKNLMAAMGQMC